ncbi:GIY-YIG nuclease family protein [Streptomyces sp. NPDC096040]|uniref:GIY-YIG nuclease family protein n=1 Tax=Streptomyces sp. NPDC096040 TaxID=3155541 RepID=UPI0033320A72
MSATNQGPEGGVGVTEFPAAFFADTRISLKAKGVFGLLATHPDGDVLSLDTLMKFSKEGRDALRGALDELEAHGYLRRAQQRNADGTTGPVTYTLSSEQAPQDAAEESTSGWAYAVRDNLSGLVKIGCTSNVQARLRGLRTASPGDLELIWQAPGGRALEAHLHETFRHYRVRGEWFDFTGSAPAASIDWAAAEWAGGAR